VSGSVFPHKPDVEGMLGVVREPRNIERAMYSELIEIVTHLLDEVEVSLLLRAQRRLFLHQRHFLCKAHGG
jgi:hypothetical protein